MPEAVDGLYYALKTLSKTYSTLPGLRYGLVDMINRYLSWIYQEEP